ncbi:MAG: alpha/beta hydrolase [Sulfuricurvum sp.]|nr:alpha/beta hydrolase [Sulfuricurvum sp.]
MHLIHSLIFLVLVSIPLTADTIKGFDADLSGYRYPYQVEYFSVESQQKTLKMAYMYIKGEEGKPVVTLLHGKNFNGAYWYESANFLHHQGYSVLIPDQIGFGKSSKPTDYQYSFGAMARNTKALMEHLGITGSIIVGHSMGGMVATRFALNYPQMSKKLILINPIGLENYLRYVEYKDVDFFYGMELAMTPEKIRAYQQKNYYDGKWNERYEALTLPLAGWSVGPDKERIAYVNALTYDMIFNQPVVEELKNLNVPAALILGTRDRTGPGRNWMKAGTVYELGRYDKLGKSILQLNGKIKLYELEGLGHLPQIEDFDRFKTVFERAVAEYE